MIEKTACFSGHRPEKLTLDGEYNPFFIEEIKSMLYLAILEAVKEGGYRRFISGMAKGVDLWACSIVLNLKNQFPDIELICALPYAAQGKYWTGQDKYEYNRFLSQASEVVVVSEKYDDTCMKRRNYYMVDNSSLLIAVCGNMNSGTGQTIRYAKKKGLDIQMIRLGDIE